MERVQKIIANRGYCSRRKAEELIKAGRVKVDGKIMTDLSFKASLKSIIEVDGKNITSDEKIYYLLNKPRGVLSTVSDDKNRKTVIDLIDDERKIYPVGRLDYDTTGLLLLTNDGELTNFLTHPSNEIEKVYIVKIKGRLSPKDEISLKRGVIIDNEKTAPAKLKIRAVNKETSIIELTIHEGKNHQVKKMFQAIDKEVLKLKRERLAFLNLRGLASGKYRPLKVKEIQKLYSLMNK